MNDDTTRTARGCGVLAFLLVVRVVSVLWAYNLGVSDAGGLP